MKKDDNQVFTSSLPRDLHKKMKIYCIEKDITIVDFIEMAVRHYLENVVNK